MTTEWEDEIRPTRLLPGRPDLLSTKPGGSGLPEACTELDEGDPLTTEPPVDISFLAGL